MFNSPAAFGSASGPVDDAQTVNFDPATKDAALTVSVHEVPASSMAQVKNCVC